MTGVFNLVSPCPVVSVPCGHHERAADAGLPIGLQVVGRRWRDDTVLRVARAVEAPGRSRLLELGQQAGQRRQRVRDDVGERRLRPLARGGGPTGRGAAAPCASRRGAPGARRCRDGRRRRPARPAPRRRPRQRRAKNSADGFCAPSSSEIRIASTSSPMASSAALAWGGWLPAMITRRPACWSAGEASADVAIQVVGVEVLAQAIGVVGTPAGQLALDVEPRANDGEGLRVGPIEGRHRTEHTEHRESRDPEPVGPSTPDAGLVDQRLADVERHRRNPVHRHRTVVSRRAQGSVRHGEDAGGGH